jgi:hypothetical protein
MHDTFKRAQGGECEFIFFITHDSITGMHSLFFKLPLNSSINIAFRLNSDLMKTCEQHYQIVTQDLKLSNAAGLLLLTLLVKLF